MAKTEMPKAEKQPTVAEYKAVIADLTETLGGMPRVIKKLEQDRDAARIAGIRLVFGDRNESARDHCIVQGFSIEDAEEAVASNRRWTSPAGGVFGIEPKHEKSTGVGAPVASEAVSPVPASGSDTVSGA